MLFFFIKNHCEHVRIIFNKINTSELFDSMNVNANEFKF
jgi:hypothetical protein